MDSRKGMAGPALALAAAVLSAGVAAGAPAADPEPPVPACAEESGIRAGPDQADRDRAMADAVSAAVDAVSRKDADSLAALFGRNVRESPGFMEGLSAMLSSVRGRIVGSGEAAAYRGGRASYGGRTLYDYDVAFVSGIRTDRGRSYELRLSAFVDGEDAEGNRGLATACMSEEGPGDSGPAAPAASAGFLPVR